MTDLLSLDQITKDSCPTVGGKGLSLGHMAQAGLPVPPGFCITSAAYRRLKGQSLHSDRSLTQQIFDAYKLLGEGPVAVRSSATAEDGSITSFAGQQETILGVTGEQALLDAINRCWASFDSERALAYRRHQQVSEDGLAMAVVVQRLVPAEVAGVLFTRDPLDSSGKRLLVEASWGLGESVVSGRVTPDRYFVDRESGAVLQKHISTKSTEWAVQGNVPVAAEKQNQPCLSDGQLGELAALGARIETFYGDARDVEWAWAKGQFWLLQARPITTGGAAEREQVRQEEIALLQAKSEPEGTVWSRYNLSEILPQPTPMTWAIVRRFMSGKGGFGMMYRDLGFEPDPALDEEGIYDLVCGRPYCNLSREPRMQSGLLPFEHRFTDLKATPTKALYPTPTANPAKAGWRFWLLLPWILFREARAAGKRGQLLRTFSGTFRQRILPVYLAAVREAAAAALDSLPGQELLQCLESSIQLTLIDFARDSLKPTALAGIAQGQLERKLAHLMGPDKAKAAVGELIMGVRPDPDADLPSAVQQLASGTLNRETFMDRFGHRGSQEMELAQPRWAEDQTILDRHVDSDGLCLSKQPANKQEIGQSWESIDKEGRLSPAQRADLEKEVCTLHTYLGLRETAKHYLLLGYAQIRRVLVEMDRRYRLNGGIFYLNPEELRQLVAGEDLSALITQRRRGRILALSLEVPQVLFSDDLEAIGRPITIAGADTLQGVPLSAGVAEAPALVLKEPNASAIPAEPYILVCPSTDPAWVPLFVHARGLVMETGGILSHGAIVAREFGLPAVAGIPDVQRRIRPGQRVRVDGASGIVTIVPD
ncbi:MAG: PEP/pyruvate-binding domain-containing protein [Gemmataceae bacterium]